MRITCTKTPKGYIFHVYRDGGNFLMELKRLVPLLLESEANIEVCDDSDPELLLRVGPLAAPYENEFLRRVKKHLEPGCPPSH